MTTEQVIEAGRAWAEREFDALPDGASVGPWRGTAVEAAPLVETSDISVDAIDDADERAAAQEERVELARACNDAARARWNELTL